MVDWQSNAVLDNDGDIQDVIPKQGWDFPADLIECAWGIIANAWEGDWSQAPAHWQAAAEEWREAYHDLLRARFRE